MMQLKEDRFIDIAGSVLLVLVGLLWAVWIQPHTIAARNIILVVGGFLGIYLIYQHRQELKYVALSNKGLWALVCIILLLAWVVFHYLFLSRNPELQWEELTSIWKRIAISLPFAIAAGFVLAQKVYQHEFSSHKRDWGIALMSVGLLIPTALYLTRYGITNYGQINEWPDALRLLYPPSSWHIPKTAYVFFCLPILALAIADLLRISKTPQLSRGKYVIRLLANVFITGLVLSVFYLENIKNGMVYSSLLIVMGTFFWMKQFFFESKKIQQRGSTTKGRYFSVIVFLVIGVFLFATLKNHIHKNESWRTLVADAKVALQTEKYDHWKYLGQKGYPQNELGKTVSITNYERVAWGKVAITFIDNYPLGYGLVLESYRHIAKEIYPESRLLQSHSAWLDLFLGLGIPGTSLILLSGLLTLLGLRSLKTDKTHFYIYPCWFIASLLLCMLTTEVAQKVYLDALIFCIALGAAYCMMWQLLSNQDSGVKSYHAVSV